jgi:hypothetical protein
MRRFLQFFLAFALASVSLAQEPSTKKDTPEFSQPLEKIYKLNFLIYELEDGKKINERTYMVPVVTVGGKARNSVFRVGDRLPVTTASLSSAQPERQIQYLDIGLSIECSVTEQADKFIVTSDLSISSVVLPEQGVAARPGGESPVIRQIRQQFTTIVSPGKPTLVTSVDDINSKKRLQVEVTATRLE